jgi:hypothetical protein
MSVTPGVARERPADRRPTRPGGLGQLSMHLHAEVLGALNYHRSDNLAGTTGMPSLEAKDHSPDSGITMIFSSLR